MHENKQIPSIARWNRAVEGIVMVGEAGCRPESDCQGLGLAEVLTLMMMSVTELWPSPALVIVPDGSVMAETF